MRAIDPFKVRMVICPRDEADRVIEGSLPHGPFKGYPLKDYTPKTGDFYAKFPEDEVEKGVIIDVIMMSRKW